MTIEYFKGRKAKGVSTDTKPVTLPDGWTFEETDTGKIYRWNGNEWIYINRTEESANKFKLAPKTSLVQLFGDTFAKTALTRGYLLENLNDDTGGNALTNNNGATFVTEKDLPLRGFTVANLVGSQYLTRATEADLEVGTNSFVAGIWFKTSVGNTQYAFSYGDITTNEQNWGIAITGTNQLSAFVDDGTTLVQVQESDLSTSTWSDNKWHVAIMFVDKSTNTMYFLAGDSPANLRLIGSADITGVGSLNNTGDTFQIGARRNATTYQSFWQGRLSNFFLYDMGAAGSEDYNLPAILAGGIRKSPLIGTGLTLQSSAGARMNNQWFETSGAVNNKITTMIHSDEGIYELTQVHATDSNRGIETFKIDGITHLTNDMYSASPVQNVRSGAKGIFLSEGWHTVEISGDSKNGSSSAHFIAFDLIELVKRDGNPEGGATSFILFGDEIIQRSNNAFELATLTTSIFNSNFNFTTDANGNFIEGDLFFKRGLWKITLTYRSIAPSGKVDLDFGNVEVLDQHETNGAAENVQVTKFVRLNGGKTNVRFAINDATNTDSQFTSIRGELVSGTGNGDSVEIWGADADFELVSGNAPLITANGGNRFNYVFDVNPTDALNDEIIFRRYFSGGSYSLDHLYTQSTEGAITDISVDSTVVINDLNQNGAISRNEKAFAIANITRGFHDVHIKAVGDGGTSAFRYSFTHLQFQKIGSLVQNGDAQDEDNENGNMVLLAKRELVKALSTVTFDLAPIDFSKYSKLVLWIGFRTSTNLNVQMTYNGVAGTGYFSFGFLHDGNVDTAKRPSNAAAFYTLATNALFANAGGEVGLITAEMDINPQLSEQKLGLLSTAVNKTTLASEYLHHTETTNVTKLNKLGFATSTGLFALGSKFFLYGVRK